MNTEEMRRAANTFDSAVDTLQRVVGQLDETIHRLTPLIGHGYGNNLERLIEQLEILNANHAENAKTLGVAKPDV